MMIALFGILPSRFWRAAMLACGAIAPIVFAANATDEAVPLALPQPGWGRIITDTNGTGTITVEVNSWARDGRLSLPLPFLNITAVRLLKGIERESLNWVFEPDGPRLFLQVPPQPPANLPAIILIETCEKTAQFNGGRIVFSASDAQAYGARAESDPGKRGLGLQLNAADRAGWDFKPTRWGMYDLELAYSAEAPAELQFDVAGHTFTVTAPSTGSLFHYATLPVGRFYLAKAEPFALSLDCHALKSGAAMELRSVTLRPAPEGPPIVQDTTDITLRASNAITHSVTMRYEPAANKNCLGYWVNPNDWAEWEFTVIHPGAYEIEVWLGCGKGNGGSDVQVESGGRNFVFQVVDTGDYHKLAPLRIGRVEFPARGRHSLAVRPLEKKAGAIMDITQVKLIPADKP
jgi:hypothetical protein